MSLRRRLLCVAMFTAAQGAWAQGTAPAAAPKDPVKRGTPVRVLVSNAGPAEIEVLGWSWGATNDMGSWTTSSLKVAPQSVDRPMDTIWSDATGHLDVIAQGSRLLRLRLKVANASAGSSIECVVDRSSNATVRVGDLTRFFSANGAANPTTCRSQ